MRNRRLRIQSAAVLIMGLAVLATPSDPVMAIPDGSTSRGTATTGALSCGDCGVCWSDDTCPSAGTMHAECGFWCDAQPACSPLTCTEFGGGEIECEVIGDWEWYWFCEEEP